MKQFMAISRALSDRNRVRILMFLRRGELCVCQIIEILKLAPSTVSKHMSILSQAGLVESRKDGRWIHYRLAQKSAPPEIRDALKWTISALRKSPEIAGDDGRLAAVLKMGKETCWNRCMNRMNSGPRRNLKGKS